MKTRRERSPLTAFNRPCCVRTWLCLNSLWRHAKRIFKIPNVCSTKTRVTQSDMLKFSSACVDGFRKGVMRKVLQGYPESPNKKPLWTPVSNSRHSPDLLKTRLSCTDPGDVATQLVICLCASHTIWKQHCSIVNLCYTYHPSRIVLDTCWNVIQIYSMDLLIPAGLYTSMYMAYT